MDRSLSRSLPFLPRYQSASPGGRASRLLRRTLPAGRSTSVPRSRVLYTACGSPHRAFFPCKVQHSPSPQRSYRQHLVATGLPSPRLTRKALSYHDISASHVYTVPDDAPSVDLQHRVNDHAACGEDLYHKGPYYPDSVQSESGVSMGDTEYSLMEEDDESLSQQSFGSSAFFELTAADSELSDAAHSAHAGRSRRRDIPSPDSNRSSPLSYTQTRRRELMVSPPGDFDRVQSRFQALKVSIPGNESPRSKSPRDGRVSSSPIAQSTPHVSPRGFGEVRLSIKACWNVDDPLESELNNTMETLDASDLPLSFRTEGSSCNSSFSEYGAADISNVSSLDHQRVSKKTKLANKTTGQNFQCNNSPEDEIYTEYSKSPKNVPVAEPGENDIEKNKSASVDIVGNEWWAVYNIESANARERQEQEDSESYMETPAVLSRNIRVVKPVKVNIPLINAGKHGQEKLLKRRSSPQTTPPLSPNSMSPPVSPKSSTPSERRSPSDDHLKTPGIDPSGDTKAFGSRKINIASTASSGAHQGSEPVIQLEQHGWSCHNNGETKGHEENEKNEDEVSRHVNAAFGNGIYQEEEEEEKEKSDIIEIMDHSGIGTDHCDQSENQGTQPNTEQLMEEAMVDCLPLTKPSEPAVSSFNVGNRIDVKNIASEDDVTADSDVKIDKVKSHSELEHRELSAQVNMEKTEEWVAGDGTDKQRACERPHHEGLGASQVSDGGSSVGGATAQVFAPLVSKREGEDRWGENEKEQNTDAVSPLDSEELIEPKAHVSQIDEVHEEDKLFVSKAVVVLCNAQGHEINNGKVVNLNSDVSESRINDFGYSCELTTTSDILVGKPVSQESDGEGSESVDGVRASDDPSCDKREEIPPCDVAMDWSIDPTLSVNNARHHRVLRENPVHQQSMSGRVVVATAQKVSDENGENTEKRFHSSSAFSPTGSSQSSFLPYKSNFHWKEEESKACDKDGSEAVNTLINNSYSHGHGANSNCSSDVFGEKVIHLPRQRETQSSDFSGVGAGKEKIGTESIHEYHVAEPSSDNKDPSDVSGTGAVVGLGKQVDVSSKHVRKTERTITTTVEKTITTQRRQDSGTDFCQERNISDSCVDVVTDKYVTETVIKEKEDYFTSTTSSTLYPDSGVGDSSFVSTLNTTSDNFSLDSSLNDSISAPSNQVSPPQVFPSGKYVEDVTVNTSSVYSPHSVPVHKGHEICTPRDRQSSQSGEHEGVTEGQYAYASNTQPSSSLEHLSNKRQASCVVGPGTGEVGSQFVGTNIISTNIDSHSMCNEPESAMHTDTESARLLDNLHAQLSQISSDLSLLETDIDTTDTQQNVYHDHAEATSVLKQIVRGDFQEFNNFPNTSPVQKLSKFPTSLPKDLDIECDANDEKSKIDLVPADEQDKEYYDNSAENATTDLRNGSSRHHIQLMKPGQLKASSLWTLKEETESLVDPLSPKSSPRRSMNNDYVETTSGQLFPPRPFPTNRLSASSEVDESDGHYSSLSTGDSSWTDRSLSSRERTPLSDSDQRMDWIEEHPPGSEQIRSFNDFVSGLQEPSRISQKSPMVESDGAQDMPPLSTFKSSLAFNLSPPQDDISLAGLEALENLSSSLEQFSNTSGFLSATESLNSSCTIESDKRVPEEFANEASCRLQSVDLDLSRISSCDSPAPSDFSEASNFTCTGTAEVKKFNDFDYDTILDTHVTIPVVHTPISTEKPLKSALKRPLPPEIRDLTECQKRTIKQFDEILYDFHKKTSPESIHEVRFMDESRSSVEPQNSVLRNTASGNLNYPPRANCDDFYKAFTNENAEKKQNNTCVVLEDENASTFRFKRFLKKSHTKRNKKGLRVLRFLSRLGCVSESVQSPDMNAHRKHMNDGQSVTFCTDSMPSPKIRKISHPTLVSSFSTYHQTQYFPTEDNDQNVLREHHDQLQSPLSSPDKSPVKSTPSSSNQSLDSLRSRADSAYSSISESTPAGHQLSWTPCPNPQSPLTESSTYNVFLNDSSRTLSTDSAFSTTPGSASTRTFSVFSEAISPNPNLDSTEAPSKNQNPDMLSALSDVFDQLDVCEGEIDTALLNRLRHGHYQVSRENKF